VRYVAKYMGDGVLLYFGYPQAHWIDPTSLEALKRSADQIRALSALLIVAFRAEFVAPWVGQSQVTSITLNRLGERDAAAIVASLAGDKELPADVLAEIVERTDGVPLFVEELTKAVLEAESESGARKTTASVPSSSAAVPAAREIPAGIFPGHREPGAYHPVGCRVYKSL
jgi:predicted ATPase